MKLKFFDKGKSKLSRRITWRVILIILLFNVLIIGAVFWFDLVVSNYESRLRAQQVIDGIEGKLLTMLRAVEITATNNVAEFENHLDSPETVFDAMEHEIRLNNQFLGFGIAFEPDYYASRGRWFEPYVKFSDSTHVERKQIGSQQHDYFCHEWYQKGMELEKGKGTLMDPYFDNAGGKCILTTYVTPVFNRQGHRVGVFGIDINLDWLKHTIAHEEEKIKDMALMEEDGDDPEDMQNLFFIQILDSKGKKIAGSEDLDSKTREAILKEDSINWKSMKVNDNPYLLCSRRLGNTEWTLVVAQHKDFVLMNGYLLGIIILFFMTVGCIVTFFFTSRRIRRVIQPLRFLSDSAKEIAQGNFDTSLPNLRHQDEIAQLRDSFDTMRQSLKQYVKELKESTAAKASIESELNVAHSIQMSMLPKTFPPFPERNDIELYGVQKPAKAVGGDLFDFFIRDEKLFFCIGDVSGKGVPASLVMAVTRTLFRNVAAHTAEPSPVVQAMNEAISEGNDNNMFVTLFVGVLDLPTGHLRYCNAGHDNPYLRGVLLPCDSNLPIGVMPGWAFTEQSVSLSAGDIIFLYTDGLTEAENAQYEQFGEQRIAHVVASFEGSPEQLIERMADAVSQFVGENEQSDDLTMLAIKYTKDK